MSDWESIAYSMQEKVTQQQQQILALQAENEALQAQVESMQENELTVDDVKMIISALGFLGCSTPESLEEACASSRLLVRKLSRIAQSLAHVKAEAVREAVSKVEEEIFSGDRIHSMQSGSITRGILAQFKTYADQLEQNG